MVSRTNSWGVRPNVVAQTVQQLKTAATNDTKVSEGERTAWVTPAEFTAIAAKVRDEFRGLSGPELRKVAEALGTEYTQSTNAPGKPLADQLGDAVDAVEYLKPLVSSLESYATPDAPTMFFDLTATAAQTVKPASGEERAQGLLLDLPPETLARLNSSAQLTSPDTTTPSVDQGGKIAAPYVVEPRALLETDSTTAAMLAGQTAPYDLWAAGKNKFDNNWGHAYVGQFAGRMFTEAVTQVVGKNGLSPLGAQVLAGVGDVFGAAVMRAKEEFDKHVTPDDVPLTVRRTFRFKVSPTETIEVTPQLTVTAGDMKHFDPTKGSQYFSVKVTF